MICTGISIFAVTQNRCADMCQVGSYLMGSSRDKVYGKQCMDCISVANTITGNNFMEVWCRFVPHRYHVVRFGFPKPSVKDRFGGIRRADGEAEVGFVYAVFTNQPVDFPQGSSCFCCNQNAPGISVQPIAKCRCKALFLIWLISAGAIKMQQHSVNQSIGGFLVIAVDNYAHRLADDQEIVVFVENLQFGRGMKKIQLFCWTCLRR